MDKSQSSTPKQMKQSSRKFLYFTAIIFNILSFTVGLTFGWTSPVIPKLQLENNPLGAPITTEEMSWLAPLVSLGAAIGPFLGGYLGDKIGRKPTLMICAVPFLTSFLILAFAPLIKLYYTARFIAGLSIGMFFTVQPMFIGEITEIHNRGMFGCLTVASATVGTLFSFCVGPYLDLKLFNLISASFLVVFLVCFGVFIPETPGYLASKNKMIESRNSLMKYRGGDQKVVDKEFLEISEGKGDNTKGGLTEIFRSKELTKGLIITTGLMAVQQAAGISVVLFYMQPIFESSKIEIAPEISPIIVGVVQVIASTIASFSVEKAGRKLLMLTSAIGTCITLTSLGYYFYLLDNNLNATHLSWLPIVALMVYIAAYNFGCGPIPLPVLSEIFPANVKSIASAITIFVCFVFSFLASKFYPILADAIGSGYSFWVFASLNALGVVFVVVVMPETKGRSNKEILSMLAK